MGFLISEDSTDFKMEIHKAHPITGYVETVAMIAEVPTSEFYTSWNINGLVAMKDEIVLSVLNLNDFSNTVYSFKNGQMREVPDEMIGVGGVQGLCKDKDGRVYAFQFLTGIIWQVFGSGSTGVW